MLTRTAMSTWFLEEIELRFSSKVLSVAPLVRATHAKMFYATNLFNRSLIACFYPVSKRDFSFNWAIASHSQKRLRWEQLMFSWTSSFPIIVPTQTSLSDPISHPPSTKNPTAFAEELSGFQMYRNTKKVGSDNEDAWYCSRLNMGEHVKTCVERILLLSGPIAFTISTSLHDPDRTYMSDQRWRTSN